MFDASLIVQSAISAFNNAALAAPAFLWYALLALPLAWVVYMFGNDLTMRIGWNKKIIQKRTALISVISTFVWVVLMGGNYSILRDGETMLPFLTAAIIFLSMMFVGSYSADLHLPKWKGNTLKNKSLIAGGVMLVLFATASCDLHTLWGAMLQVGALVLGWVFGRAARNEMRPVAGTVLILMTVVCAILMQPEFFRFGQLGALTGAHLVALAVTGLCAAMVFVLRNVKPKNRIHHSAYIKLKWMTRFIVLLGFVLFVMTESLPVFLGLLGAGVVMFALSVYHMKKIPEYMADKLFAILLVAFGVITVMPVISALGILYFVNLPKTNLIYEIKFLL